MDGTVESKLLQYKANFYRTRTARIIATSEDSQRGRAVWGCLCGLGGVGYVVTVRGSG